MPPTASQDKLSLPGIGFLQVLCRNSANTFRIRRTSPLGDTRGKLYSVAKLVVVCPALGHSSSVEEADNRHSCRPGAHVSDSAGLTGYTNTSYTNTHTYTLYMHAHTLLYTHAVHTYVHAHNIPTHTHVYTQTCVHMCAHTSVTSLPGVPSNIS